jgi:(4-(4-[2-(gamma-L-glutamylamino)ethyl]phenoxymethyl)furan-2-yl)methanamine synthase
MNQLNYIGWDIGGAHLKVAAINESGKLGFAEQFALPIWQGVTKLEELIPNVLKKLPGKSNSHAITITAELSDVFNNREEGVNSLINIGEQNLGSDINFYAVNNGLLKLNAARNNVMNIASANWHVSASYVAKLVGSGVFIDVGSTTTDIIPFKNHQLINQGIDDQSRMRNDELIYSGVIRTPLMALANKAVFEGEWQNIAAENFATTADIYRILSCLEESDDVMEAADGKKKDVDGSLRRLARMLGTDFSDAINRNSWNELARYFQDKQLALLSKATSNVLSRVNDNDVKIVGAGAGSFLAEKVAQTINVPCVSFGDLCVSDISLKHKCNVCAPAVAVAHLNKQLLEN